MSDDNPEGERVEGEFSPETTRLVQSQLGKTVDLDTGGNWHRKDNELLEAIGLNSSRIDWSAEEISFTEQYVGKAMERYPGIFTEDGIIIKDMAERKDHNLVFAIRPFRLVQSLESPEDFVGNRIKGVRGIPARTKLQTEDWREAVLIASMFPEKLQERLPGEIEKEEIMLQRIDGVIKQYEEGNRPTTEDCLQGRSITEPTLQFLVGGTPEEGFSSVIVSLGSSFSLNLGKHKVGKPGAEVSADLSVLVGSTEVMQESSQVAKDYLSFISEIMEQNPEVKRGQYKEPGKLERVVGEYLDLEWQQRDRAIIIAKSMRDVLRKKIEFHQSLLK